MPEAVGRLSRRRIHSLSVLVEEHELRLVLGNHQSCSHLPAAVMKEEPGLLIVGDELRPWLAARFVSGISEEGDSAGR